MRTKLVSPAVLTALAGLLLSLEGRRPLRAARAPRRRRQAKNLALAGLAAVTIAALEGPLARMLTRRAEQRRLGLLPALGLPRPLETAAAVLLLDATQWLWHWLAHEVTLLWRFHAVHHVDPDLDTTTATRFHPGELLLSVPFRAAQIRLLGVGPQALSAWQTLTTAQILFHHANVRLPERLERTLGAVLVTPRMHGIHHSNRADEQGSNWGTIFSFFDRALGVHRGDVPQASITIGLPGDDAALRDPALGEALALPFTSIASSRRCGPRGRARG